MLLQLAGRALTALGPTSAHPYLARVTARHDLPAAARSREVLLLDDAGDDLPAGFRGYLLRHGRRPRAETDAFALAKAFDYLTAGDVVRIDPARGQLRVLFRPTSPNNFFLITERCDNYCVMCSQPPKERDDGWLLDELFELVPLLPPDTRELGITGGEPLLAGDRFVQLLRRLSRQLPATALHVLTNGRALADDDLARRLAEVRHRDLVFAVPLYAAVAERHDFVVQARGAHDQTLRGLLNLHRHRLATEIRFVLHRHTVPELVETARFIARNLTFASHVALMGLEPIGFAKANLDDLWIDPADYQHELRAAVGELRRAGLRVSIYNHQLCTLDRDLHPFAVRSISDWKSGYVEECDRCDARSACGGFFASAAARRSRAIAPLHLDRRDVLTVR